MGLLDDLVGQLTGGATARDTEPARASAGPGMGTVMAALLPVVLGMLRSGERGQKAGFTPSGSGGLGDILGQLTGGRGGSGAGGLGAILEQFQRAGFGDQARSWVGTGRNMPVSVLVTMSIARVAKS